MVGPHNSEREKKFIASWTGDWRGFSDDKRWFLKADIYRTQKNNWVIHLTTVCKASLLTDRENWQDSGDYLLDSKRSDLYVGKTMDDFKNKVPGDLLKTISELSEKEKTPVEVLDI